jgi:glycosyltransferase involved in cell wall biosynthesis
VTAASHVTPVVLTFDEEPNIGRLLDDLSWARTVVVVDSGSTDRTAEIARCFANVRWLVRPFETHAAQWQFGVDSADTDYALTLDADYRVPADFVRELDRTFLPGAFVSGVAAFRYCIHGHPLRGSVYPPKVVVVRRDSMRIRQPGHSQVIDAAGPQYRFTARLSHDDRKPLERFVRSQLQYARLEADRVRSDETPRWQDRLRRTALMPFVAAPGAYLAAGGPLAGWPAVQYACERTVFETLLAMELMKRRRFGGDVATGDVHLHPRHQRLPR